MQVLSIILLAAGLILGYNIAYFRLKNSRALSPEQAEALEKKREEDLQHISRLKERNENLCAQLKDSRQAEEHARRHANEVANNRAELRADYRNLKQRLAEQKKEMKALQERFKEEFENLANRILEEKSKKFTEQNEQKLDQLLKPLGEKMEAFKKKVEETHKDQVEGRGSLKQQLKNLMELNKKMSEEAQNLTNALKGDTKTQGSWGEMVLERILERSGLKKGREYEVQVSEYDSQNQLQRPDAVVYLPDDKYMIIDSKVSLKAYEKFASSDDEEKSKQALGEHLNSIKSHVKGLGAKNYQHLFEEKSPDFVLMFVPIESAFGAAFQTDPSLYNYAFERNIVIVSPSTLLATLATINNVWKREYQNQNAQKIAERGGLLYDKFVGFVESLEKVGMRIRQSQESYDTAMGRLKTGRGDLIGQAEKLRDLGASASKKLPDKHTNGNHLKAENEMEDD